MICTGTCGENAGFVLAEAGDFLNQDLGADFLSNQEFGIYLFIPWRSVFDLIRQAMVKVIVMKSTVDSAEDIRLTLNQY